MADIEINVDVSQAIEGLTQLNQALAQVHATGRSSKKKLQPLVDDIEALGASLTSFPKKDVDALKASLISILSTPSTMKGAVSQLIASIDRIIINVNKGTNLVTAAKNREVRVHRESEVKKTEATVAETAKREAALNKEDRLRSLKGLKPLNPQLKYNTEEERSAALEGIRRKEDEAAEAHHTKQRAREAKTVEEFEKTAIEREKIQRRLIEQGVREAGTFDSLASADKGLENDAKAKFNKFVAAARTQGAELQKLNLRTFNQGLADATKAYNDEKDLKAAAINERIKQIEEGENRTQDILDDSAAINAARIQANINLDRKFQALAAKERAKKAQKIASEAEAAEKKATKDFQAEVNKRIKAARDFEDAKRSGFTKGQFDSLKGRKLDDLETGARVSSGSPRDQFEAAAVKQMAENFKAAKASQDEVIAGAKRLGIPLRENVERAKEFTLSWKAMGRIVVAQAFTQVFFSMQNAIKQSTTEAVDLYKAVAQIQTIVSESSRGLANYSSALSTILDVSSDINFTPQDTANAFYDTLSNQIGDNVTQIREFIGAAGDLAKTTRSTLADSADAITAVMNAYGEGASSAEEISALLFATVDKGRVKLDAIANHMGNVAVPAAQLGIEFGKVGQALAALTIAGVTESEAMTLQRNVMFQLIKPTEDMINLFHEWGVSSGQSAIAAFGFSGVIEKLAVEAEQGNERIAELFGTIRGVRGVQGLIGSSFEKLNDTFEDGTKAIEAYNKSVDEYVSNSGEKFSKLQQEISNEFLRMGLRIVDLTVKFNDMIGVTSDGDAVLSKAVATIAKLGLVLGAAGSAFLIVMAAFGVGAAAIAAIPAAIFGTTVAIAALVAGLAGGLIGVAAFTKSAAQEFGELKANVEKANAGIAESFEKGIIKSLADTDAVSKNSQVALASLADATAALNAEIKDKEAKKALDDLAAGLDNLIKAFGGDDAAQKLFHIFSSADKVRELYGDMAYLTNDYLRDTISGHEKEADSIQQVIDKLEEQRKKLFDIAKENRNSLAESITERNINALPDNQRGRAQYQAAQGAASAGANAVDIDEAERLFDIANRFLADAERTAFESGAFGTIENHTRFFNKQQADLVALEERRLRVEDQRLAGLQAINAEQQAGYTKEATQFEKELDRRKNKETQFKIEKEFLEEYIRLRDQILKNDELSSDVQKERLDILTAQAAQGLDAIGASQGTRDAFSKELDKNGILNQTRVLYAEEERLTKQHKAYTEALKETDLAVEKYGNTLEESISAIEVAAREVLKNLPKDVDPTAVKVDAGGITRIGSSIPNKEGTALVKELEQLNKAVEAGSITPEQAYSSLVDIASRVERLRASNSISNKNASGSLDAGLKGLEAATAQKSLAEALVRKTQDLEKALSDLTLEIRSMTGFRAETPEEAYDRRLREQGNAGSSEGEGVEKTISNSIQSFVDNVIDNFSQIADATLARLSITEGRWGGPVTSNTALGAAKAAAKFGPYVGAVKSVSDATDLFGNDEAYKQALSDGMSDFNRNMGVLRSISDVLVEVGRITYSTLDRFNFANGKMADGAIAVVAAQEAVQAQLQEAIIPAEQANVSDVQANVEAEANLIRQKEANAIAEQQVIEQNKQIVNNPPKDYPQNYINGVPWIDDGRNNSINGVPFEKKIYPDNYINGVPWIDDGAAAASASFAVEQGVQTGAQAIPQAMELGAQSIYDAIKAALPTQQTPQYYAKGGPVGTDTVPAWLSPGEFVVRAQAVRKNFDVLQAINAGTFQRFSNGGSVSNSQVFSSTFNMKTTNPQMQAAQIMSIMKRQISQGKATLGKGRPY